MNSEKRSNKTKDKRRRCLERKPLIGYLLSNQFFLNKIHFIGGYSDNEFQQKLQVFSQLFTLTEIEFHSSISELIQIIESRFPVIVAFHVSSNFLMREENFLISQNPLQQHTTIVSRIFRRVKVYLHKC